MSNETLIYQIIRTREIVEMFISLKFKSYLISTYSIKYKMSDTEFVENAIEFENEMNLKLVRQLLRCCS